MSDQAVAALIQAHVQRYPEIDILDVYKLLHQGMFGPGHAIPNKKAAREFLEHEMEILTAHVGEVLLESVHPEGQIVRLHLRPYATANGNLRKLLDAFIQSGAATYGTGDEFATWWAIFQSMTEQGRPLGNRFPLRTVSLIGRTRANQQWPATPHSPAYDRAYKPAYRVLRRDIAEKLLIDQKIAIKII